VRQIDILNFKAGLEFLRCLGLETSWDPILYQPYKSICNCVLYSISSCFLWRIKAAGVHLDIPWRPLTTHSPSVLDSIFGFWRFINWFTYLLTYLLGAYCVIVSSAIDPKYLIPSRHHLSNKIVPEMVAANIAEIHKVLKNARHVSDTLDTWQADWCMSYVT